MRKFEDMREEHDGEEIRGSVTGVDPPKEKHQRTRRIMRC